jgi:hypothetical protein
MEYETMRLQTYFILIFCMCLVFYFMGFQSAMFQLTDQQGNPDPKSFFGAIAQNITSENLVWTLLGLAAVGIGTYLTGFSAMFIIPLLILVTILNLVVVSPSIFLGSNTPYGSLFYTFFYLLAILAYVEFVRGSI